MIFVDIVFYQMFLGNNPAAIYTVDKVAISHDESRVLYRKLF